MSGGLVPESSGDATTHDPTGEGTVEFTTAPVMGPEDSHLDSFFATSGWTREDAELAVTILHTLVLAYLAYREVKR